MGKYVPLKFLFNEELAEKIADSICKHDPCFSKSIFVDSVACKVENLELKQRIEVIADELHNALQKILINTYITENIRTRKYNRSRHIYKWIYVHACCKIH